MDEKTIKAEMRLYAMETFVASLLLALCLQNAPDDPLAAFEKIRAQMTKGLRRQTFPDVDPAMSDLLSAELEAAATRLAAMVSEQINVVVKARRGL